MDRRTTAQVALTLLVGATLLVGPASVEANPPQGVASTTTSTVQARVMTWNVGTVNPADVRLPNRFEKMVAQTIVDKKVQVVCLQEVQSLAQARRLRDLIVERGGPVYSVTVSASIPSRKDGRSTAMLWTGDSHGTRVFQSTKGDQAQALILNKVTVVNVHGPAGEYKNRRVYYPELAEWVKKLPQPVILTGDFNIGPKGGAGMAAVLPWLKTKDKELYRDLLKGFAKSTNVGSTTMYGLIFDHVMITKGRIVSQAKDTSKRTFPMDHHPLIAEVVMPVPEDRFPAKTVVAKGALKGGKKDGAIGALRRTPR